MSEKENPESKQSRAKDLRREAERRSHGKFPAPLEGAAEVDMRAMLHELQVHQIELEMQNEDLLRAHTDLQELSDNYRDLFDFAPAGYFGLDEQGRMVELNLAGAALLGVDRAAAIGRRFRNYVAPGAQARYAQFAHAVRNGERKQDCEIELRKGEETVCALLEGVAAPNWNGNCGLRIAATDITERKQLENALTFLTHCGRSGTGEDFFQLLARYLGQTLGMDFVGIDRLSEDCLEAQTVGVYQDGRIVDNGTYALKDTPYGEGGGKAICCFSRDVCRLFPRDALLGRLKAEGYVGVKLWSFSGKPIGLMRLVSRQELPRLEKVEAILKLVAGRAAGELERRDADIQLRATLCDLRKAQDELVRAERLAMLGQLAGTVAHEMRTPLTVIQNSVYFLESTLPPGDQTTCEVLSEMNRAVGQSNDINTEMLDYVREPSPQRAIFPVGDAVSRALQLARLPDSLRLHDLPGEAAQIKIRANLDQVTRILLNLIHNAVQAMPHGGELEIGVSRQGKDAVCIQVRDTGCGVPHEDMEKIFEPLFSTKTTGIGLGLPIARRYAQLNGGQLSVESEPGYGTIFRLVLEQAPESAI